jgi:hypothetical protein
LKPGVRGAVAAAFGLEIAVLAYALLRVVAFALFREPNPALVLFSLHSGYFWRAWTAAYAGALAAAIGAFAARYRPRAMVTALEGLLPWVVAALVAQAIAVP